MGGKCEEVGGGGRAAKRGKNSPGVLFEVSQVMIRFGHHPRMIVTSHVLMGELLHIFRRAGPSTPVIEVIPRLKK